MTSILVTDDDEMIRAITVSRLEREGYEVSIAGMGYRLWRNWPNNRST